MSERTFLRIAGALAALTAVTTLLLWLLPKLQSDVAAMARLWVNFVHVAAALTAYSAAVSLLRDKSPALAGAALMWLAIWGATELGGVAVQIFAVKGAWRGERAAIDAFAIVWDALFFMILVAFLLGTVLLGLALARGGGLRRVVGLLHLAAGPLTVLIIVGGYFGGEWASTVSGWVYPALQPPSRALLGVWIWKESLASDD